MYSARLTPEEVYEAYEKRGLGIVRNVSLEDNEGTLSACGIGAYGYDLYLERCEVEKIEERVGVSRIPWIRWWISEYVNERFGRDYVAGFTSGFDGVAREHAPEALARKGAYDRLSRYHQGVEDGEICREYVMQSRLDKALSRQEHVPEPMLALEAV